MSPLNINTTIVHCYFNGTAHGQHEKGQQRSQIQHHKVVPSLMLHSFILDPPQCGHTHHSEVAH